MSIREAYEKRLIGEGHERDPSQEAVIALFEDLQRRLRRARPGRRWTRLLRRRANPDNDFCRGLYLWGGVGRGKTFLMDLFFETLAIERKKRIHFHRMMRDVHTRLKSHGEIENPVDRVAADIAAVTRVLCFDEFFVTDIGDAMILAKLLEGLFDRGVTLVATSNSHPDELYRDGLQRQRFLPAIELIKSNTRVERIEGDTDYRLRLLKQAGTFLAPDDDRAHEKLQRLFGEAASSQIAENRMLEINNREIRARRCAKGIAWFDFAELCEGPRSQNDYIEIARWYPTVIVSGVPRLDKNREDQARRFIALVDEFYDRRVKLIVSAAAEPVNLYSGFKLQFEFERTASRLIEMQSTDYLAAPHLA